VIQQTSFSLSIDAFVEKTKAKADVVLQKVVLEMFSRLIQRSPVGNPSLWKWPAPAGYVGGQFRSAWRVDGPGMQWAAVSDATDPFHKFTGAEVLAASIITAATPQLLRIKAGGVTTISNQMPYGPRLEYGWSDQAPQGMVRVTIAEFDQITREVISLQS
jgi:hypothetical protein